eukprot:Gb_39824 [translate_table: standard]
MILNKIRIQFRLNQDVNKRADDWTPTKRYRSSACMWPPQ